MSEYNTGDDHVRLDAADVSWSIGTRTFQRAYVYGPRRVPIWVNIEGLGWELQTEKIIKVVDLEAGEALVIEDDA